MQKTYPPLTLWLAVMALSIVLMIGVGGITRLTDSGLSIVKWKPITGTLPPLTQDAWQIEFDEYKTSPEFIQHNATMTLGEFKGIYWWEYSHRLMGRLVGIFFLIPFVFFIVRRKIPKKIIPHLAMIFVLGGLQGAMGWYMVKSGLVDEPFVSPLRLMAHLGLALAIYGYMLVMMTRLNPVEVTRSSQIQKLRSRMHGLLGFVTLTILSGALVAGLDAGLVFNTFPLMDGEVVPQGYFALDPWYTNLFRDHGTVQFHHRCLAMVTFAYGCWAWYVSLSCELPRRLSLICHALFLVLCMQVTLGILTLIFAVPLVLAILHQLNAVLLFTLSLFMLCWLPRREKNV